MCLTILIASSRSLLASLLLSVCVGAITIDSPVWIPSGSKFSMLQTVIQLSYLSLTTSYSISFHPFKDFSTKTCGENENAFSARATNSSSLSQKPEPKPPSAYAALRITGYPNSNAALFASAIVSTASLFIVSTSISFNFSTNSSLSSVSMIAWTGVPRTCTSYFSNMPVLYSSTPQFNAV